MKLTLVLLISIFTLQPGFAEQIPVLDQPYTDLVHPVATLDFDFSDLLKPNRPLFRRDRPNDSIKRKSDTLEVISHQSMVKSQGSRGTCSIFSTIGYIEGRLLALNLADSAIDLSEEWLEYLAVRFHTEDGASAYTNISHLKENGILHEQDWPYDPTKWESGSTETKKTCGHLDQESNLFKSCLLVHRDPRLLDKSEQDLSDESSDFFDLDFLQFKKSAPQKRDQFKELFDRQTHWVYRHADIKQLLQEGKPLILGLDFFYGAWNHRYMEKYNIGTPNQENWRKGIVGHPEPGSIDAELSKLHRAGHSFVIVGYDDDKEVTTTSRFKTIDRDGNETIQEKTFTYKGVYYFKNSWGTFGFGTDFEIDGVVWPGYGMITQKYAHQYGGFAYIE